MKFCPALNGSLNIERDRVHFCVAVKQTMPTIPWDPDTDLPLDRIRKVRDALAMHLNDDMDLPVEAYVRYGLRGSNPGHPCKGCRHMQEIDTDRPVLPSGKLDCYLHMQAFTYCNAKCTYCNLRMEPGATPISRGRDLDKAVYKAVMDLLEKDLIDPSCRIIFSSGEPSLSKAGMAALSQINAKGFNTLINTNAIEYAPEIEAALKGGKAHVQISLESGDRQSYIQVKGVDRFDHVANTIDRYLKAVQGNSMVWIKYIIFSQTNSSENMDKFADFCVAHNIRNVVVSANYNEGEDVSQNCLGRQSVDGEPGQEEVADQKSLEAFGYLTTKLELLGVNVHKEFSHLTQNEQKLAKQQYARAVLEVLGYNGGNIEDSIEKIVEGMELVLLPEESARLKHYFTDLLQSVATKTGNVALFGAGAHAHWISGIMKRVGMQPAVAFDNNPNARQSFPFPVVTPDRATGYDIDTVLIASNAYHLPIYAQLKGMAAFDGVRIIDPYMNLEAP